MPCEKLEVAGHFKVWRLTLSQNQNVGLLPILSASLTLQPKMNMLMALRVATDMVVDCKIALAVVFALTGVFKLEPGVYGPIESFQVVFVTLE